LYVPQNIEMKKFARLEAFFTWWQEDWFNEGFIFTNFAQPEVLSLEKKITTALYSSSMSGYSKQIFASSTFLVFSYLVHSKYVQRLIMKDTHRHGHFRRSYCLQNYSSFHMWLEWLFVSGLLVCTISPSDHLCISDHVHMFFSLS
jgi:hypothetical protein